MHNFRYNVIIDTVLEQDGETYILAPGQAFPVWKDLGLFRKFRSGVKLELRDALSYSETKAGTTKHCLLGSLPGDACYLPVEDCVNRSRPQSRSILGYDCGLSVYRVDRYGLSFEKKSKLMAGDVIADLLRSRSASRSVEPYSIATSCTWDGIAIPTLMAVVDNFSGLDGYSYRMWTPDHHVVDLVALPIPMVLTKYETLVPGDRYDEADIALHQKRLRKAIDTFLKKYKVKEVYIGLPREGDRPYEKSEDMEKLYTRKEYREYSPVNSFRVSHSVAWNPGRRFAPIEDGAVSELYDIIRGGELEFPTL